MKNKKIFLNATVTMFVIFFVISIIFIFHIKILPSTFH
jgi:hypothetical protein